jgi:hypothetical protein
MPTRKPTTRPDPDEPVLRRVKVKDLRPNPYRRLDQYPLDPDKVQKLKQSIETDEFWANITGRRVGRYVEIAFGHHRLAAIRQLFKPTDKITIVIRELSNEQMIKLMAWENRKEWGASIWSYVETLEATIEAYRQGQITLPPVPAKTNTGEKSPIRYASPDSVMHPYTKSTVAMALGWTKKANDGRTLQPNWECGVAFLVLDAMDKGLLSAETLEATIEAYRQGQISLPPVPDKTPGSAIRYVARDSLQRD